MEKIKKYLHFFLFMLYFFYKENRHVRFKFFDVLQKV
jgi:hypothetical protein